MPSHTRHFACYCERPIVGKKVILSSHQHKPKAGAADPVYHQNQALGLEGALPSSVRTGKYEQSLLTRA